MPEDVDVERFASVGFKESLNSFAEGVRRKTLEEDLGGFRSKELIKDCDQARR